MKGITLKVLLSALIVSNVSADPVVADALVRGAQAASQARVSTADIWGDVMRQSLKTRGINAVAQSVAEVGAPVVTEVGAPIVTKLTDPVVTEVAKAGFFAGLIARVKSIGSTIYSKLPSISLPSMERVKALIPSMAQVKAFATDKRVIASAVAVAALYGAYKYFTRTTAQAKVITKATVDAEIENAVKYVETHKEQLNTLAQTNTGVANGLKIIAKANVVSAETRTKKADKLYATVHNAYKYIRLQLKKQAALETAQTA